LSTEKKRNKKQHGEKFKKESWIFGKTGSQDKTPGKGGLNPALNQ